jgi:transcriptional regulator with XRE-family HTH domain
VKDPVFDQRLSATVLDAFRASRGLTWRQVAEQAGVTPSTLTRVQQGRSPNVDGFPALCRWAGLTDVGRFIRTGGRGRP